ncbi:L,D-transpeptidase [Microvirga antarctica]|uniref:L,D-transpeptidase n=1 Tax=Microvirga antarctica TaxID=2819233 RepID=UPI001FEB57BD|nr:L,D-transpeptidase [Microvirga antarctica]
MRDKLLISAVMLSLLIPVSASAQPFPQGARDVYGNRLTVPGYGHSYGSDYPPGYPADGYAEQYPLVTRPAMRPRARAVDPMTGYAYGTRPGEDPYERSPVSLPAYEPAEPGISSAIAPQYQRQVVAYRGKEPAGTIIIDTPSKYLYLVQGDGRALRYGIGVGRPGFEWAGRKSVSMKKEWPDWRPPKEMLQRRPDLPTYMEGGPDNPLGARALYLGSSLYRIHGTNEPDTIGHAVSSGCIRMLNRDVIDLYNRVPVGAQVVVI